MTIEFNPFKTISSRTAWSCPWYRVRQDAIITPDGRAGVYNVIEKPDAVWIVPITTHGQVAMVHQFRYTVGEWCLEVPAGSVKPGQTIEEAAREELREEVGGTANSLDYIGRFFPANGICNEVGHVFLATGVRLGMTHHEAAEVMSVTLKSPREALHMARQGEISDGSTALALLLCADRLAGLKPGEP
ncbi:MAG: NUDIX hydrolase [Candidatus Promineofilum sp.]|uniref:NUDIX hydrolase n=1 Tax=Promineifilum sp. TaxID=2664178 RepID=UPI002411E985|nr:NUDIX hydrolase [Promineifilum sp.]